MTNRIILISFACVSLINAARVDDWWEYANFYQVYPRSFQDSDGDGVGDLKGITQRLEYFEYLGIDGIWLSPIFKSPMKDFGYDITDYREIHHEYGTMADFKELLRRCHELNIKLILDFVPNHSSDQHVWFKASSDPNHPRYRKYKDYYIWHDGAKAENGTVIGPPSNWLSVFRNSAWTFHPKRKQYYLHQFLPSQPDLNFRNPAVAQEMNDILRFWYDKGVDGFRIDAIPFLFEVEENPATGRYDDEPLSGWCDPDQHCYLKHIHTDNLDETFEMVYQWRKLSDSYKDSTRILMTEAYSSVDDNMRYYGGVVDGELVDGVHIPFNFEFISHAREESNAYVYEECIWNWLYKMPNRPGVHANWLLGNHDQKRIGSKYGAARVDLLNIMLKTLPGMSITYYGEEIGMNDVHISWEDTVDPQACLTNPDIYSYVSRDPARSPMQWNSTRNAGFSSGRKTWLPLAKDFKTNNIELQTRQQESHLKVFKSLVELRNHPTMRYGQVHTRVYEYDVLVYTREIEENLEAEVFFIILNFGSQNMSVPLSSAMAIAPEKLKVVLTSTKSDLFVGQTVDSASISIEAGGAAILVGKRVQRIGLAVSIYTVSGLVFVFILVRLYCHFRNRNSKPSS